MHHVLPELTFKDKTPQGMEHVCLWRHHWRDHIWPFAMCCTPVTNDHVRNKQWFSYPWGHDYDDFGTSLRSASDLWAVSVPAYGVYRSTPRLSCHSNQTSTNVMSRHTSSFSSVALSGDVSPSSARDPVSVVARETNEKPLNVNKPFQLFFLVR